MRTMCVCLAKPRRQRCTFEPTRRRAEVSLRRAMEQAAMAPPEEHHQGDERGAPVDFFTRAPSISPAASCSPPPRLGSTTSTPPAPAAATSAWTPSSSICRSVLYDPNEGHIDPSGVTHAYAGAGRGDVPPHRHRQAQRRRPTGLARRCACPHRRTAAHPGARAAALELESRPETRPGRIGALLPHAPSPTPPGVRGSGPFVLRYPPDGYACTTAHSAVRHPPRASQARNSCARSAPSPRRSSGDATAASQKRPRPRPSTAPYPNRRGNLVQNHASADPPHEKDHPVPPPHICEGGPLAPLTYSRRPATNLYIPDKLGKPGTARVYHVPTHRSRNPEKPVRQHPASD